ncbi:MAG: septation protein SpoVG family protein [Candidatus Omnitrophota bacterium]|nr:septation protein SpoVG family protein [Candidatus Omnitrophota bacterium]
MEITEIKIFMKEGQDKKLKAYATLTLDNAFVVRNVKVIEGTKGLFVAMPSRKIKEPCPKCGFRNAVRSKYCNQCGGSLPQSHEPRPVQPGEDMARQSEHKDIAHPITAECRDYIQKKVLDAYENEKTKGPSTRPSAPSTVPQSAPQHRGPHAIGDVEEDNDIEL